MDFSVTLNRVNSLEYLFEDDEFKPFDTSEGEPSSIWGSILVDDKEIGRVLLYEIYNDNDFLYCCDRMSGDCVAIASAVCGKSGAVLKKYLCGEAEYNYIYILDQITINSQYRNLGIGSAVVKNLLNMIRYQFNEGSTIFLCASDYEAAHQHGFQSEEYREGTNRLIQFYMKLGYRVIKDNIMVYNDRRHL